MNGQLSLFDLIPHELNVGDYVETCGQVIPRIMRKGYIGRRVLVDKSTESMTIYQVGILEKVIPYDGTERSIVYTGKKQRQLVTHYPGREIHEVLPWTEKRLK